MRALRGKGTMDKLTKGLTKLGQGRKIDQNNSFMAVNVDYCGHCEMGPIFAISHSFIQNGDCMMDPEMQFIRGFDGKYYPITFRQDGGLPMDQEVILWDDENPGKVKAWAPKLQSSLKSFGDQWMRNIAAQQGI